MERKIKNLQDHISFLYEELESKEIEIDDLTKSLDRASDNCRKQSASNSDDQREIVELTKVIDEQKVKIKCLRMHRNEILDRHEKSIDDYEKEFKAKEIDIKQLQEASNGRRQQIVDLKEELSVKDEKICDLQDKLANKEAIEDLNLT